MVYVKADVPDDVHTKIKIKAAKAGQDTRIEDVVRDQLIEAFSE